MSTKIIEESINIENAATWKEMQKALSNYNPSFVRLSSEAAIDRSAEIAKIMNRKIDKNGE